MVLQLGLCWSHPFIVFMIGTVIRLLSSSYFIVIVISCKFGIHLGFLFCFPIPLFMGKLRVNSGGSLRRWVNHSAFGENLDLEVWGNPPWFQEVSWWSTRSVKSQIQADSPSRMMVECRIFLPWSGLTLPFLKAAWFKTFMWIWHDIDMAWKYCSCQQSLGSKDMGKRRVGKLGQSLLTFMNDT